MSKNDDRIPFEIAKNNAEKIKENLALHGVHMEISGSILRGKNDIGDIDFVISAEDYKTLHEKVPFINGLDFKWTKGSKKSPSRITHAYITIDNRLTKVEFYVAKPNALGAMNLFATGSGKFNVRMRRIAQNKGLKLSQYGLFDLNDNLITADEREIFDKLEMKYLEPHDREEG